MPSILQQSFISVGNLFVQGLINSYGSAVVAGYLCGYSINTFAITCFTTLGNGLSSFTAQNTGAGKTERISQGFRAGVKLVLCVAVPAFLLFFIFGPSVIRLFMSKGGEAAAQVGVGFLRIVSPFYMIISFKLIADGVLRGSGSMKAFIYSHLYRPGFKGSSGIRVISALWCRRYLDVLAGRMGDEMGFPCFSISQVCGKRRAALYNM